MKGPEYDKIYFLKHGLFAHKYNEVSNNLFGCGQLVCKNSAVFFDQEHDGNYIFHCIDEGVPLDFYVKFPIEYFEEHIATEEDFRKNVKDGELNYEEAKNVRP